MFADEHAVETLVSMGFERDCAIVALQDSKNIIDDAINLLLKQDIRESIVLPEEKKIPEIRTTTNDVSYKKLQLSNADEGTVSCNVR